MGKSSAGNHLGDSVTSLIVRRTGDWEVVG